LNADLLIGCTTNTCSSFETSCFSRLAGYLFVNAAANQSPATWDGFTVFWEGTPNNELGTIIGVPFPIIDSPLHQGSTGIVPFGVNSRRSFPRNVPFPPYLSLLTETVLTSAFNGTFLPSNVEMHMTGPVSVGSTNNQPQLTVALMKATDPTEPLLDVSRFVTVERDPNRPHVINLRAKDGNSVPLPSGIYRVTRMTGTNRVTCDQLLPGAPITEVADFEYRFRLTPDCDNNGVADSSGACGSTSICDPIDFNNDGIFPDDQDAADFFEVFAGGSCSTGNCNDIDFNNDFTFPDDNDMEAYFRVLAGGQCAG
jgi:hypothetical protein